MRVDMRSDQERLETEHFQELGRLLGEVLAELEHIRNVLDKEVDTRNKADG